MRSPQAFLSPSLERRGNEASQVVRLSGLAPTRPIILSYTQTLQVYTYNIVQHSSHIHRQDGCRVLYFPHPCLAVIEDKATSATMTTASIIYVHVHNYPRTCIYSLGRDGNHCVCMLVWSVRVCPSTGQLLFGPCRIWLHLLSSVCSPSQLQAYIFRYTYTSLF